MSNHKETNSSEISNVPGLSSFQNELVNKLDMGMFTESEYSNLTLMVEKEQYVPLMLDLRMKAFNLNNIAEFIQNCLTNDNV